MGGLGGETNDEAAARTDDLLTLTIQDLQLQQDGPKIIVGDVNGPLEAFINFSDSVTNGSLIDIGGHW